MSKSTEANTATTSPTAPRTALLTTAEAAAYMKMQVSTLEQHRWNGRGCRFIKIGRSVRYRQSDIDEYLNARVFRNTTEAGACAHAMPMAA